MANDTDVAMIILGEPCLLLLMVDAGGAEVDGLAIGENEGSRIPTRSRTVVSLTMRVDAH